MNAGDVIARIIRINTLDDLFDSGPETQWILKESANLFFTDLNAILREYAILLVCRLTGPAKSFGKANLSTQRFTNLMRDSGCLTPEIEHLDAALREHRELLKPARNKIIAAQRGAQTLAAQKDNTRPPDVFLRALGGRDDRLQSLTVAGRYAISGYRGCSQSARSL